MALNAERIDMVRRFVLDGAPGSGKSTLLFGASDGVRYESSLHTMQRLGYHCVHESVGQAHGILAERGLSFVQDKALWLETIAELDRDKFHAAEEGVNFFDRSFHHWRHLSRTMDIPLPEWYDRLDATLRYDSPIFLVAPVASFDLADESIRPSRRFTWEQRMEMHRQLGDMYRKLGYEVVEVPVFSEGNVETNNLERIDRILEHVR